MQYEIHERYFADVERKIQRIIRKCEKYGNPFTFEVVGEKMYEDKDEEGKFHKFFVIEAEGVAKVNGWEFVATLNIRNNANVIRRYNTEIELPERFKTSTNVCEHCNTERNRNNLYVVYNSDTEEFRQVGNTCLKSYTGIDLENVAAIIDGIDHLEKYNGLNDSFYNGGTHYYDVKTIIGLANVLIGKTGYLNVNNSLSTKTMVTTMLYTRDSMEKRIENLNKDLEYSMFTIRFSEKDFKNCSTSDDVENIINYYMELDDNSEFIHNIKTIISDGYATWKDLGFLCYTPQGYAKHLEKEIERAKRRAEKQIHWGEVGKRYRNIPIQNVRHVAAYETVYGVMNVWNIVLEDDTVLTWKSGNYIEDGISKVTFTIKEHGEHNGKLQTVVTRCSFAA